MALVLAGVLLWARLRHEDVETLAALAPGFLVAVLAYVVLAVVSVLAESAGLAALHGADRRQRHQQPLARVGHGLGLDEVLPHPRQHDLVPGAARAWPPRRPPVVGEPAQRRPQAQPGDGRPGDLGHGAVRDSLRGR